MNIIVSEMQFKMRHHFISTRLAKIKTLIILNAGNSYTLKMGTDR